MDNEQLKALETEAAAHGDLATAGAARIARGLGKSVPKSIDITPEVRLVGVDEDVVTIEVRGRLHRLPWALLRRCAAQDDREVGAAYGRVLTAARDVVRARRNVDAEAVSLQCAHRAETWATRPFEGPVYKPVGDERPAAHGNVTLVETCRCGAERRTNVNGRHAEQGSWVLAPVAPRDRDLAIVQNIDLTAPDMAQ